MRFGGAPVALVPENGDEEGRDDDADGAQELQLPHVLRDVRRVAQKRHDVLRDLRHVRRRVIANFFVVHCFIVNRLKISSINGEVTKIIRRPNDL